MPRSKPDASLPTPPASVPSPEAAASERVRLELEALDDSPGADASTPSDTGIEPAGPPYGKPLAVLLVVVLFWSWLAPSAVAQTFSKRPVDDVDGPRSIYAADLDGDGDLDLLATATFDSIVWYENDGAADPGFTRHVVAGGLNNPQQIVAADLDDDGDLDLAVTVRNTDDVLWYENDGAADPSFTLRVVGALDTPIGLHVADLDGDGDLDLLATALNVDDVVWYENDGAADPSFTRHFVDSNLNGATDVYAADVDGDDDLDVVAAAEIGDDVVWYENDGAADPSFTKHVVDSSFDGARSVHLADVDGDNDLDLLATALWADEVVWYENDGAADPAFTKRIVDAASNYPTDVYAADVDGDGDLDLLATAASDDDVVWYENDGAADPSFIKRVLDPRYGNANSIYAADVDGDGDLDLLATANGGDEVAWYENRPGQTVTTTTDEIDGSCDDGDCSLRDAISAASTGEFITFAIASCVTCSIPLYAPLPLSKRLTIDGTTQADADCGATMAERALTIAFDASAVASGDAVVITGPFANGATIRGVAIHSAGDEGIYANNADNLTLECLNIGTNVTGTTLLPNGGDGILLGGSTGSANNTIDGVIIGGSGRYGIVIAGAGTTGNTVTGSYIGTDRTGTQDFGNASAGILVSTTVDGFNAIGTTAAGAGNLIRFNGTEANAHPGILIDSDDATTRVLQTASYDNAGLPIDLGDDGSTANDSEGPTANDVGDEDSGPNKLQNYPVISAVIFGGGDATVDYHVDTDPAHAIYPLRIEFYETDGDGEPIRYLGADVYDEADYDGCGSAPCPATATIIDGALTNGTGVVAIATDNGGLEGGSTSEFSMNPISLPVEMASFEAVQDAGTVRLTWATASEANNAGFHVQHRRADAAAKGATTPPWTSAGFVPGHGTTTEARSYMHRVEGLAPGRYQFRLKQVDHDGATGYSPEVEVTVGVVGEVLLSDAYPNPFNPQTQFTLAVAHAQPVRIAVYDALGREVAVLHEGPMAANRTETVTWRAGAVPSGVYFVRAVGERFVQTRRVMLVK